LHLFALQVQVHVVEKAQDVEPGLAALHASMRDPLIGIDMEWKPDSKWGTNKVAMLQLASSSVALLIRTCHLDNEIPKPIIHFCKSDLLAPSLLPICKSEVQHLLL
jgi:hypothetical protein